MAKAYSESFKRIIDGKVEGVDYIVIRENEPRIWHDGEMDTPYEMDFTQMEINARKNGADVLVGANGGLCAAFDPNTHTMILTARSDMIEEYDYDTKCRGLYVPFSDQTHEPADSMKAAALNYQDEIDKRAKERDDYGRNWRHYDQSDSVAFLTAVLPTLKTKEEKEKVARLIEENARYTMTSNGYQKGRNDERVFMPAGQRFIIPLREKLDRKEMQALALKHLEWENNLFAEKGKEEPPKGSFKKTLSMATKIKGLDEASAEEQKARETAVEKALKAGKRRSEINVQDLRDAEGRARGRKLYKMLKAQQTK